jgi:alkylation response protein AidB-like acyl-CoA dehydrogenase
VAALLTEVGRRAAPVPALATLMLGVLPVVRWGDRKLQEALLPGVASGEAVLTAALREPSDPLPAALATTVRLEAGRGTVSGVKIGVPHAAAARHILIPAIITTGRPGPAHTPVTGIVIIDPAADGVTLCRAPTSGDGAEYTVQLAEAPVSHVLAATPDGRAVRDLYQLAIAGACSVADGALAAALELTTAHVGARQQFGRPLAAFQAVAQQIADSYILARTLHLATVSACWRLHTGRDAERDLAVAGYWLAALHDRVHTWAAARTGPDGRPLLAEPDVRRALALSYAGLRVNELLNWQVATTDQVDMADASATKVYSSVQVQQLGQLLEEVVGRHGPADPQTAELACWLDIQAKRNTVLTFGGGSNEILRELIAAAGLGLPRVPR